MVSECSSSLKKLFSFKLFGIFVNVSNKKPPLHKAGGTLGDILQKITKKTQTNMKTLKLLILILTIQTVNAQEAVKLPGDATLKRRIIKNRQF